MFTESLLNKNPCSFTIRRYAGVGAHMDGDLRVVRLAENLFAIGNGIDFPLIIRIWPQFLLKTQREHGASPEDNLRTCLPTSSLSLWWMLTAMFCQPPAFLLASMKPMTCDPLRGRWQPAPLSRPHRPRPLSTFPNHRCKSTSIAILPLETSIRPQTTTSKTRMTGTSSVVLPSLTIALYVREYIYSIPVLIILRNSLWTYWPTRFCRLLCPPIPPIPGKSSKLCAAMIQPQVVYSV